MDGWCEGFWRWLQLQDVFGDKDIARQLVRQHVIAAQLTLAELTNASAFYMLEGSSAELFYKVDTVDHSEIALLSVLC